MLDEKRVYWRCRRGMLEIDLFLLPFVETVYPNLSEREQADFIELLDEADPDLFNWLMGYTQPEASHLQTMCEKIRQHAKDATTTD